MPVTSIIRASTAADGTQGDGGSFSPVFSPDGTKVAFTSGATNLVPGDTNGADDIFVKILATGAIERVSTGAAGAQANGSSGGPVFSLDGTKVAFTSGATNLVAGDTNDKDDVFVKDLTTGAIVRISTDTAGAQGNGQSGGPVFSPDGTKVAFGSNASNLVPGDTNNAGDVFVKDLATGAISLVSTAADGTLGNNTSYDPKFSPDGTKVALSSIATNLVPGDTAGWPDIFLKDLTTGAIARISTDAAGTLANHESEDPVFSPDGTKVAFESYASNLVPGDTNGSPDIFLKTLATGALVRISTDAAGGQGNGGSYDAVFSPDGTKVAFYSEAFNLLTGDTNNYPGVFVKTLATGAIELISTDAAGVEGDQASFKPAFSPDGTKVAFGSYASNLVPGDTNGVGDIYVVTLATPPATIFHNIGDNTNRSQFKAAYVGNDSIDGTGSADRIRGWAGRDTILGEGGNDEIRGDGVGLPYDPDLPDTDLARFADSILAGAGNDSVWGGGGNDTLLGEDGNDRLYGQGGGDSIDGGRGADEINGGENNDTCRGGADNDWIAGGPGLDSLDGDDGNDKIYAFAPDSEASRWGWIDDGTGDQIEGGNGNDTLIGGKGVDTLTGGAGADVMSGSSGDDIFRYGAASETGNSLTTCDVITDFQQGHDKIDLKDIDASSVLAGNNTFLWRGTGPFTTSGEGELRYQQYNNAGTANDYTVIFGDTDSDTASEFQIKLQGLVTLTQADFILGPVGAKVVFTANDGSHGRELWRSDGTETGTVLVKDINPGGGSDPSGLTNVNGTLYFSADDGSHGQELWKSDGSTAGTLLVKDINPGSNGSGPGNLTNVNGTLFFAADNGTGGQELWKSNGTAAGTVLVKDINPGGGGSDPGNLTNVNGTLFFSADDGTGGRELWKSNGTAAGTVLVKDINPGSSSSIDWWGNSSTDVNGTLYFWADDGTHGRELWKSNGTAAGTVLVKDINPGGGGSDPGNLTNVNGTLFFSADDGAGGRELWKSNGTAAGTVLVKDINPGGGGSDPGDLTNVNGTLYFAANDGTNGGGDLWKSDGSAAGTVLVKDIDAVDPLADWDIGGLDGLTAVDGALFFLRWQGNGFYRTNQVLWKSDGTEAGTVPVADLPGATIEGLTNANGTLIFDAGEQACVCTHGGCGCWSIGDLWKSDGTEAGTVMVKEIWPGHPGNEGPNPADITPFDFVLV